MLPKTIDYYQMELTAMLENERYAEAIDLLRFLLTCRHEDPQTSQEWTMLLDWLEENFEALGGNSEERDMTESEMAARTVRLKAEEDKQYVKNLLDTLLLHPSYEQKMTALEQLSYIEHPQINSTLIRWLETMDIHPFIQYKVLGVLKIRGVKGDVSFSKSGETVTVNIEDTPLGLDDHPSLLSDVVKRVRSVFEIEHPSLSYFAEQTWTDFLTYIYGAQMYNKMVKSANDGDTIHIWAAALHNVTLQTVMGPHADEDAKKRYEVKESEISCYEQFVKILKNFVENSHSKN